MPRPGDIKDYDFTQVNLGTSILRHPRILKFGAGELDPNRSFSVSLRWKGSFYPEVLRRSMQIFGSGKLYAGLLIQCENDVGMASPQHSKF
ncbi:hypothetical protein M0657_008036 [Pyricularia oryzae]|nr:hypothetical protein M0657_008036 [Pyricularia oryzae]KAI7918934.1 hypothetical protein M9X92_006635 [Pyricularia oryzae]